MQKAPVKRKNPGISVINKTKLVRVRIPRPWINKEWYFDSDPELDNSIITGIRLLAADGDYNPAGSTDLTFPQLTGFYLNMVDYQNRKRFDSCPVITFLGTNATPTTYKRPFTRTRLRIRLDKCYVINAQDPTFPDDGNPRFIFFQINYRPVTI